ncbi:Ribophorin I-domain-containing protein [Chytridium lagenaria]|nr:Ribophorin I-domain-containing protein [Chytridium lagenaria]
MSSSHSIHFLQETYCDDETIAALLLLLSLVVAHPSQQLRTLCCQEHRPYGHWHCPREDQHPLLDADAKLESYEFSIPTTLAANISYIDILERRDRKVATGVNWIMQREVKAVKPFPKVIDQTDPQRLEFNTNAYVSSPYPTEKQKTTTSFSFLNVVTFGPYQDVGAKAFSPLNVHYEDNKGLLVAKTYRKDVEISHLGDIWPSWRATTFITAALYANSKFNLMKSLRGSAFSRVDYQFTAHRHQQTNVVKEVRIHLPGNISNVYYRDDIGNVSTSNLRKGKQNSLLHIRLVNPLYGGWKSRLRTDVSTFSVPFIGSIKNVSIETATLSVALPDGATNVKVSLFPFTADDQFVDTYYTNLDTLGRPRVNIVKKNVADEFAISYDFPSYLLLRKPVIVSSVVFGFLLLGMVIARVDLAIVKTKDDVKKEKLQREAISIIASSQKVDAAFATLTNAFDAAKASKKFSVFKTEAKAILFSIQDQIEAIESSKKRTEILDVATYTTLVEMLIKELKSKVEKAKMLHEAVIVFLEEAANGVDEKRKKGVQDVVADLEGLCEWIDGRVEGLLEALKKGKY